MRTIPQLRSPSARPPFAHPPSGGRRGATAREAAYVLTARATVGAIVLWAAVTSPSRADASHVASATGHPTPAISAAWRDSGSAAGRWMWPVATARAVLRPFEQPEHDYGAGHRGIDIAATTGVIVTSPAPGIVLFAGRVAGRSILTIDHGGGVVSSYDPALASVSVGDVVAPGQPVAVLEGAAQHCDTGCVHVGVRRQGEYIDPLPFFFPPKRSVLLPLNDDAG